MKKFLKLLFIVFISCFIYINVNAKDESLNLVNNSVNLQFDNVKYDNLSVYRQNGKLYFKTSVTNLSKKKIPLSFNVLLFNSDGINIGLFNYCSLKDIETNYSYYELTSNKSISFNYEISKKYLANYDKYKLDDVNQYSVIDSNEYCKIGGYNKYEGKNLDQILNNDRIMNTNENETIDMSKLEKIKKIFSKLDFKIDSKLISILVVPLIILIVVCVGFGLLLKPLNKNMFKDDTKKVFLPIYNIYYSLKLSFGKTLSKIYMIIYLLSFALIFINLSIINILLSVVMFASIAINIIKLITKNYALCYLEKDNPFKEANNSKNDNSVNNEQNVYGFNQNDNLKETMNLNGDLSIDKVEDKKEESIISNNNEDGESELSKFFK